MPYVIKKRESKWCVESTTSGKTHGCHDTRADAVKQQRALYKNAPPAEEAAKAAAILTELAGEAVLPIPEVLPEIAEGSSDALLTEMVEHMTKSIEEPGSSEASVTMSAVEKSVPIRDVALLRLALKRSEVESEQEVEKAVTVAAGLADPEVAAQTVAVIGHLADRLRTAELNQAALVDALQTMSADSSASRGALLEALSGITERLAEAPQVHVTVPPSPPPDVYVNVEQAGKRVVDLQRDSTGKLIGATTGTRTIELERDESGKLVGATVEEEGADHGQEAA